MQMTKKQLQIFYKEKASFIESAQVLQSLRQHLNLISSRGDDETGSEQAIRAGIRDLESALEEKRVFIRRGEQDVLDTLALIEDPCDRVAARLHYCDGLPWCEVSSAMGESERAITTRVQTAMKCVTLAE